ncbi:MAG: PIN domain-containing protein [Thiothrix sp.]|nr:MAG: PIN domain-containing protein [Thiothrix sp.]
MIGLDTNILARYFIEDDGDHEACKHRELARVLIESGKALMVSKTVILELEWVMRGYYKFEREEIASVLSALISFPNVTIEDVLSVEQAIDGFEQGLDFADALHHASYKACDAMATFDEKKFSKKAMKLGLVPKVFVPKS